MIASLRGKILSISPEGMIVLDVNGIGFEVLTSVSAAESLQRSAGDEVTVFTYMYVREDAMLLYGFQTRDELALFRMLITVSGIGPKGALSLLSALGADALRFAILSGDSRTIAKAPGIGKKTAERLVIDLRDKMELRAGSGEESDDLAAGVFHEEGDGSETSDAVAALTALGYSRTDAVKAVRQAEKDGLSGTEALLKGALRYIM